MENAASLIAVVCLVQACTSVGHASTLAVPAAAAAYVEEAWTGNLALQTQALDVETARARLSEARSAYQPRIDLVARFTRADGGRTVDIPVGDLLNPVYASLNDWLASQGQPPGFSPIENQSFLLLREREQETALRVTQPIYRPAIGHGVRARRADVFSREAAFSAYRRELRLTVLAGYYSCLQAESAVEIFDAAAAVTAEAVRAQRALFEVDRATEDRVLRAEADDLMVEQQRTAARRDRNTARSYFNFLLNRPLDTPVERAGEYELSTVADDIVAGGPLTDLSPDGREELAALHHAADAAEASEAAVRAGSRPTLALAVDGGVQGENYRTGSESNFVRGSLIAELNLWDGRERRSQETQARLERRRLELDLARTRQQLALEIRQTEDELRAAVAAYHASARRQAAADRAFELVAQREREGLVSQLAFLDARNERTRAALDHAITRQQLFTAAAALDRAAALTPLP